MVTTLVGQVLYLLMAVAFGLVLARILHIDYALGCLAAGVLAGLLPPVIDYDAVLRAYNLNQLVFFVVLPVLIFEAAWQLDPRALKRWLGPVLLLAILGVAVFTVIAATLLYYGTHHPAGFPWTAALLTGAALATTDPVAVVAKLRSRGAGEDLLILMEGESLFNDTAAIVLFGLVLGLATHSVEGAAQPFGGAMLHFAWSFIGGLALGALCGLATVALVLFLRAVGSALMILVLAAFGSFYLAEQIAGVSGILAVMMCAIVARAGLQLREKDRLVGAAFTWEWLALALTGLVFVIMGLTITFEMFGQHWFAMLIAIAAALGGRALAIFTVAPLARFVGPPISKPWRLLLGWGSLRGVIAIALALSIPTQLPYWWTVQSMVFGVVLFSLLVQGTSSGWLITKLSE